MKRNTVNEIIFLRSIACLSIVLLHSIGIGMTTIYTNDMAKFLLDCLHVILYFGTPMFIFISEFILSYSYKNRQLPSHFLRKRVMYIFLPFCSMAIFYSLPYASSFHDWLSKFFLNVFIGDFHGYFILIIFQFYILHFFFHRLLQKIKPTYPLIISFVINTTYLVIFNFISAPETIPFHNYVWDRYYWVPFIGWIFYFTLGFYCGLYYKTFIKLLNRYKWIVLTAPILSTTVLLFHYHFDIISTHSSKRVDMLFHTTAMCFLFFYMSQKLKSIPPPLKVINSYSFSIYLLHMFYLSAIDFLVDHLNLKLGAIYIIVLFVASTVSSIVTANLILKWKYGAFIVGKVVKNSHMSSKYTHSLKKVSSN
ncbi:acyltransferase family protein [Halalkalibacter akibai]|uniref:Acyltransferase 3 domain-containing protein n=1 Tax=Halalkalibacter akibai (strain ATCC 43226 / DSM 21942 / CIP 109018 / JCM 9157 / 1139) TaxID=1236973 RepID=W4QSG1_HALA3|nr:acyltransferase family protein [Halalkalibacter akibai]GAE34274.1 hypothetical protein JCM9157_1320 [Halalkalibacter akibai JCM 9157]